MGGIPNSYPTGEEGTLLPSQALSPHSLYE